MPLFTIRTFSIEGTQRQISSAISTSRGFGIPKLTPRRSGLADRLDHDPRRMPENRRTPGADVVDVFVAIDIPDVRAFRAIDKKWFAPETAEGPHGGIDAAGNATCGPREELSEREVIGHCERSTFNVQRPTSNVERLREEPLR